MGARLLTLAVAGVGFVGVIWNAKSYGQVFGCLRVGVGKQICPPRSDILIHQKLTLDVIFGHVAGQGNAFLQFLHYARQLLSARAVPVTALALV